MTDHSERRPTLWTRRDLLTRSGWGLLVASFGAATIGAVRLLFPRVSFAPPTSVVIGRPEEIAVGEVSEQWKRTHRFVLVREETGFYALRSICTHLGCITDWQPSIDAFKCPCHGSAFRRDGKNFEGPAPRPLERLEIFLDQHGQIVVDTRRGLRQERGEWESERAYLPYPPPERSDG